MQAAGLTAIPVRGKCSAHEAVRTRSGHQGEPDDLLARVAIIALRAKSPVRLRAEELGRQSPQVLRAAGHEGPAEAQASRGDPQREAVAAALACGGAVQHTLLLAARRPHLRQSVSRSPATSWRSCHWKTNQGLSSMEWSV